MYSIGLDIGTTSVCGLLHNAADGEIIKSVTLDNDSFIETENKWEKIQDPKRLLCILKEATDMLLSENLPVASIGITGQMHGIVYLNKDGKPASELKIWQDERGNLPFRDGKTYAEYMTEKSGYPLASGYGAVTLFYDFQKGLIPEDAVTFCTIHDLAAMTLCGRTKPIVHPSDAASFGLYKIKDNAFDRSAVENLGLDYSLFPEISGNTEILGYYNGIPVALAIGDNQASFLGSVSDMDKSILVNVGTGSQISCLTDTPPDDKTIDCRPLIDGKYILAGSALAGGRAYAVLERFLRETACTVTGICVESAYAAMDKLMENYDDEIQNPLIVDTAFSGTRADPEKRGSITNISSENLTVRNLCDGVMCGIANELTEMYDKISGNTEKRHTCLIGSGNGLRFNPALRRRFEKIFQMPVKMSANNEEAAFGASLFALCASGVFDSIQSAQKLIKYCE